MSLKFGIVAKISLSLVFLSIIALGTYTYVGRYLWQEASPDGQYTLRYYRSFNPFLNPWFVPGTPGNSRCKAIWIRLYNTKGEKLNEVFTDDCHLEFVTKWFSDQVFLPNLDIWELPNPVTKDTDLNAP